VQANMRSVDTKSGAVVDTFAPVDTATYGQAGSHVVAVGRGVPLNRLPPGAYRLDVQASNADGSSTSWRSAPFSVMEAAPLELSRTATEKKEEVILNVTALDSNQRPVADLTSADFQIFEDNQPQTITSIKVTSPRNERASPAPPIVILFDLLNTVPQQREYIASRMIKVLEPLETDEGIYVYLLTNEGALYPVRPKGTMQAAAIAQGSIGGGNGGITNDAPPWTKEIRMLLDHAIAEVHGFRLMDYKNEAMCTVITFDRLGQIAGQMANVRGPKTILWVTSGVPNSIAYPYGGCQDKTFYGASNSYLAGKCGWECHPNPSDTKCLDYTPFLQHFAAETAAAETTVSSVAVTATGLLDFERGTAANTLRQLADLTGGQLYMDKNSEVEKAIKAALLEAKGRYQLAFAAMAKDGKYHKVRVASTREGVHIVAPQGYFAVAP
jgi:VWFA-related protein